MQVAYQIIHDDENQQILEIQYHADTTLDEQITITEATPEQVQQVQENIILGDVEEGQEVHIQATPSLQQLLTQKKEEDVQQSPEVQEVQEVQQVHELQTVQQVEEIIQVQESEPAAQSQIQEMQQQLKSALADEPISNPQLTRSLMQLKSALGNEPITNPEPTGSQTVTAEPEVVPLLSQTLHPSAGSPDFVSNPDFNSQEYYNWLSSFTELCKMVPMPLDVDLFQKISQVHKTLSDVLATPKGILTDKENFRTLMNISKELSAIINEHLTFVLQNLEATKL